MAVISADRQEVLRKCDQLCNFEITREELLAQGSDTPVEVADSTTDNEGTPKKPAPKKSKLSKPKNDQIKAAKARAHLIFQETDSGDDKMVIAEQKHQIEQLQRQLRMQGEFNLLDYTLIFDL